MKSFRLLLLAGVFSADQLVGQSAAVTVSGEVTDTGGWPVAGARITFANETSPSQFFSARTGTDGSYRVALEMITAVEQGSISPLPTAFHLFQNYPNPFNPSTRISYQVGATAHVRLRIYNLLGQPIRTLVDEVQPAGLQAVEWDGHGDNGVGVGAGLYVVRMEAEGFAQSRKMVLVDGAGGPGSYGPPAQKPIASELERQDLYTVSIAGGDIESFSRMGIVIRADTPLDFQVVRLQAPAIVVEAGGDIAAAMKRAGRGSLVILSAGTYSGQTVDLKEGVVLRGKEWSRTILSGGFLVASHLSGAALENVTVRNSGSDTGPAISILESAVALRDCRIEDNGTFCAIQVEGRSARATIQGCSIRDNRGGGVWVKAGAQARLSQNTIERNGGGTAGGAVRLSDAWTEVVMCDNAIKDNTTVGLVVEQGAEGQIVGNTFGGSQNGIELRGHGATPTIRDNTLSGEGMGTVGIKVGEGANGQIIANTIAGYAVGIQITGTPGLRIDIRENTLRDNGRDVDLSNPDILWMNRFTLAQRDLRAGQFAMAAEAFRLVVAEASDPLYQVEARYFLGVALMRMDRFDEAIPVFEEVLDRAPQHLKARWNLMIACRQTGRDPDALEERYRLTLASGLPPSHEPARFTDVGAEAGVALVNMGRASAWRDLDNDGWLDLFTVADGGPQTLFRNQGDGTFAEITASAGLAEWRGGWSALWIDYDNDGAGDLFVTRDAFNGWGINTLYHNEGEGRFANFTRRAGLWVIDDSFGAAWGDYDNDGWLDLYVGNGISQKGRSNALYHNNQDGTFTEVAEEAGVDNGRQPTVGVVWGDYDNDGWLDLYVVNNGAANALYRNKGDGTFADVTEAAGVARPWEGFVAFFFDYDNDGWLDLLVSNFAWTMEEVIQSAITGEPSLSPDNRAFLYHNNRDGTFTDVAPQAGLGWTLGTMAATHGDIDNDGYQDLYLANGGPAMDRFEPDRLFLNNGDGTFAEVTEAAGLSILGKGHGTAMADYDNDGDLDIYSPQGGASVNPGDAQPNRLYRNEGSPNHWLIVRVIGRAGADTSTPPFSNRDGVGAKVTLRIGVQLRYAEVSGGCGFGVTNSLPVEFGLGAAGRVDAVEVRWPSGRVDRVRDVPADQVLTIIEGMEESDGQGGS